MGRDLSLNLDSILALTGAGPLTGDTNGATVDLQNYNRARIQAVVGTSGDTLSGSVYAELEVEHSDDGSTWADCADTDIIGNVTGTNTGTFAVINDPAEDDSAHHCGYIGGKRYIRIVVNLTGTHTNGIPIMAAVIGESKD